MPVQMPNNADKLTEPMQPKVRKISRFQVSHVIEDDASRSSAKPMEIPLEKLAIDTQQQAVAPNLQMHPVELKSPESINAMVAFPTPTDMAAMHPHQYQPAQAVNQIQQQPMQDATMQQQQHTQLPSAITQHVLQAATAIVAPLVPNNIMQQQVQQLIERTKIANSHHWSSHFLMK